MSPVQLLVKFIYAKDNTYSFFVQLRIHFLVFVESSIGKYYRAF